MEQELEINNLALVYEAGAKSYLERIIKSLKRQDIEYQEYAHPSLPDEDNVEAFLQELLVKHDYIIVVISSQTVTAQSFGVKLKDFQAQAKFINVCPVYLASPN